jgi:NitT/TauT family transport system substrate-binding protein
LPAAAFAAYEEPMKRIACVRRTALLLALVLFGMAGLTSASGAATGSDPVVRVGVLKYGSVNWGLDVLRQHRLDGKEGFALEVVELATPLALQVALLGGQVDIITTDWIWVSRQRAVGRDFTFAPYTTALGALVVPDSSSVRELADLKGRRLGVAGGPLDKSWLLLRALFSKRHKENLDERVEAVFGTPPLLNQQIQAGRIDAVITYWNYAARLKGAGYRRVLGVREAVRELGVESQVPLLGYVFSEKWAERNHAAILGFLAASRQAMGILGRSDTEWERIAPLLRADDQRTQVALRESYRSGIPRRWGARERRDADYLFRVLRETGGEKLTGPSLSLQAGTFWRDYKF